MINQTELQSLFTYDPTNGNLLWAVKRQRIRIGQVAGTPNAYGYRVIWVKRPYMAHHLVWLWHHGYLPKELDHINHITDDNRIENLRLATRQQNTVHRRIHRNNTSGYKGVRFVTQQKAWIAVSEYQRNGKRGSHVIGYFPTPDLAAVAYNIDLMAHHPEFGLLNEINTPLGQIMGMSSQINL